PRRWWSACVPPWPSRSSSSVCRFPACVPVSTWTKAWRCSVRRSPVATATVTAMPVDETLPVRSSHDIVVVRQVVRTWAVELGFNLIEQTRIVTAASELARNAIDHGGGGTVRLQPLRDGGRVGLRLTFEDKGPGIPDLALALKDGYTTGGGLGLG